jgi:hypothetical protein
LDHHAFTKFTSIYFKVNLVYPVSWRQWHKHCNRFHFSL